MNPSYIKHEIISCERCGTAIECRANSYTKCQCSVVELSINEMQYISETFDSCLCANCLMELKQEYQHQQEHTLHDIRRAD
ncbi:cysteine-rich CWC family protein [Olivibacter ginsenosidimutans]|uniref:cysteine-rich CWC family protein n=1 Tax=Olivibacter ginsenosidimutans TaxID=1176537 RepID=UPI0031E76C08